MKTRIALVFMSFLLVGCAAAPVRNTTDITTISAPRATVIAKAIETALTVEPPMGPYSLHSQSENKLVFRHLVSIDGFFNNVSLNMYKSSRVGTSNADMYFQVELTLFEVGSTTRVSAQLSEIFVPSGSSNTAEKIFASTGEKNMQLLNDYVSKLKAACEARP